ncbi:MAG: XRE family transcriptional regulator [Mogibacterium sp.]|nr:XRE family transcriptional regulator [Mogibacterium sp.]
MKTDDSKSRKSKMNDIRSEKSKTNDRKSQKSKLNDSKSQNRKEKRNEPDSSSFRYKVARELAVERMMSQVSQEELAERLGTQKSSVSRIESGKQNLTLDYVDDIAYALGKEPVMMLREILELEYGDYSRYCLKIYDETLLEFSMERTPSLKIEILKVNEKRKEVFPLDLELTPQGIMNWLSHRTIPKHREKVGDILDSLGISKGDIKGIIDVCMGLSLNDSYWVPQKSLEKTYAEMNLYENEFSGALALIAYTGNYMGLEKKLRTTPELTTGGMLRKAWRFFGLDNIWLYKGGTFGFANSGNEPYSEHYAAQVAERMGINAIHYDIENWQGILASKCKLFTDIDTAYIPIGRVVTEGGIDAVLDYYKNQGESFYEQLVDMLVFDAVIINEDRHYGNFGVLRDNKSGKIIAPAPVFDNGVSLLCYAMKDDFEENKLKKYIGERTNPYGYDNQFIPLAKRIMGKRQRNMLRKLINFKFEDSDVSAFPRWRIEALEEVVQERVAELLK